MHIPAKALVAILFVALLSAPALAQKGGNGEGNGNGNGNGSESGNNGNGNGGSNGNNGNGNGNGRQEENPAASDAIVVVQDDQQVVQNAVRAKAALSLDQITAVVGGDSDGRILDVQLVTFKGIYLYDVTVLEKDGVLHKLYYNARSGVRVRTD